MVSGIGSGNSLSLLTSLSRGGLSPSSVLSSQGAVNMIQNSIMNLDNINTARDMARKRSQGLSTFDASRALFGDSSRNLLNTLGSSSRARIQQALQNGGASSADDRQNLVRRLSQLSLEQLLVLKNAVSDDPEVEVSRGLQRSVDSMSDRDRLTFKLSVNDAIDNVTARQNNQGVNQEA